MTGYDPLQGNTMQPLKVSVCSSANVINVQGFIDELSVKYPDLALDVQYFELPYNDIDNFKFKEADVGIMILCHSINNRRFAITDVMDALYDRFLPNSAKILGKDRICVLAHDFPKTKGLENPDKYEAEMLIFKNRQGTTFKISGLVMMGGKLEGPVELQEINWEHLREFLENAARLPMPEPREGFCEPGMEKLYRNRVRVITGIVVIGLLALIIGLGVGLSNSSEETTPSPTTVLLIITTDAPSNHATTNQPHVEKDTTPNPITTNQPPPAG